MQQSHSAFKIISTNKKKSRNLWVLNNIVFPLVVIVSPYLLTIIHGNYGTVQFSKSFINILIGGSLSLSGINILRTSSTIISEKLSYDKVPPEYIEKISDVESEINTIKKRLNAWSWILSGIGFFLYFIQIGQFINDSKTIVYWFLFAIILIFILSLFFGRFISLMETNLFEREEFTKLLFSKLITQNLDFSELENLLKEQGL